MNDMYIDIGAESREDALKYVNYGDSINFEGDFKINGKTVVTKALDDRFGCYVLINLIKSEPEYDMYFTFVVQEEVGLRGARPAALRSILILLLLLKAQLPLMLQRLIHRIRYAICQKAQRLP